MSQERASTDDSQAICVGCRQEGRRRDLERFVFHDELGVVYDMRGGAPGASAWLHPLPGCIGAACWAGFARAFGEVLEDLEPEELYEDLDDGLHRRFHEQVTEAVRLGRAAVGATEVEEELESGALELVVLDSDADDAFVERIRSAADEETTVFDDVRPGAVGDALGGETSVLGVPEGEHAEALGRTLEKLICLHSEDPEPFDD